MMSGGSMATNADPVRTASMRAEKVLPQLRSQLLGEGYAGT